MPHFVCLGDVVVNVDMIVDAGWVTFSRDGGRTRALVVSFNAPTPKLVDTDDGDTLPGVACRQIVIPETDAAARNLWSLLRSLCDPMKPIGDMPGKVIATQ